MKKTLLLAAMALGLAGCVSSEGDYYDSAGYYERRDPGYVVVDRRDDWRRDERWRDRRRDWRREERREDRREARREARRDEARQERREDARREMREERRENRQERRVERRAAPIVGVGRVSPEEAARQGGGDSGGRVFRSSR